MSDTREDKVAKLIDQMGFDPTKRSGPAADAISDAFDEIQAERKEKAKEEAKKLALEAVAILEEKKKFEKDYKKACEKFDKDFDKVWKKINGVAAIAAGDKPEEAAAPVEK